MSCMMHDEGLFFTSREKDWDSGRRRRVAGFLEVQCRGMHASALLKFIFKS